MWKFVTRRIRDSVEKTYNVLETRRTWTCGGEKLPNTSNASNSSLSSTTDEEDIISFQEQSSHKQLLHNSVYFHNKQQWNGSSSSEKDDFKQSCNNDCKFQQNILGAITWSGAIVCGWYTSQILCMRRRNHREGWNSRCKYSKTLLSPSQAFHTNVLSHWVLTAPEQNSKAKVWYDAAFDDNLERRKRLYEINNDKEPHNHSSKEKRHKQKVSPHQSVNGAAHDLLKVIGDIEFQLGVQNMEAQQFNIAATHFKLGTSHRHAGATFNLGICFELGLGVERDLKMALECYQIASSMGHPKAMYNVGIFHVHGLGGLEKNRKTARQYFIAAAKLNLIDAQNAVGMRKAYKHEGQSYEAQMVAVA